MIDIVQAAGRAMRTAEGKKYGYIIVPIVVPDKVDIDVFAASTEFKEVVATIRPLAAQDTRITDYLRSVSEGKKPTGPPNIEIDMPAILAEKIDQSEFSNAIELKVWDKVAAVNWRSFEDARVYCQGLGLNSAREWEGYCGKNELPKDIPHYPPLVFRQAGWDGWGDFLGSGNRRNKRTTLEFEEARRISRKLSLKSAAEWRDFTRSKGFPDGMPKKPEDRYRRSGWTDWNDWLDTKNRNLKSVKFREFKKACEFVNGLELLTKAQWIEYAKSNSRPQDIPSRPEHTYKNKGWTSYRDWIGKRYNPPQERKYLTFIKARMIVNALGLRSHKEWNALKKAGNLRSDIPPAPWNYYSGKGWVKMRDWLGTNSNFLEYQDARKTVRSLNLPSVTAWKEFSRSSQFPSNLPRTPEKVYKNSGWSDYRDWLGTDISYTQRKSIRSFENARLFASSLSLTSNKEWVALSKAGKLPSDVPRQPDYTYQNDGWMGWRNFLGTENKRLNLKYTLSFEEARNIARSLGIERGSSWKNLGRQKKLPEQMPLTPEIVYAKHGWNGWADWLGTEKPQKNDRLA